MITPNPIIGTGIHAIGGISASTCYLPFEKTKRWSWGSFWIIQATFAWLLMPLVIGLITVPNLIQILRMTPSSVWFIPFILGAVYGFGGLSFGYAIRHIGFSLTYTISIGISAILGTITPLIIHGTLIETFAKPGGGIVLFGMVLSMTGVMFCGAAGYKKEKDLKVQTESRELSTFNMRKGLLLVLLAGVLSAIFGVSLELGQPISDRAAEFGAGHFEGNAKLIVTTTGCFITNIIWFLVAGFRQGTIRELINFKGLGGKSMSRNYLLSALAGSLWYFQFFFYGLAHVKMGNFMFASWVIHMSMLIFFSFIVGMVMKEWKKVTQKTYKTLILGLSVLIISFIVITWGSYYGS